MILNSFDAEHFIYGLRPDGSMSTYSVSRKDRLHAQNNEVNIWALKQQVPALDTFLNLWSIGRHVKSTQSAKGWLDGIFRQIEAQMLPPKIELQRAAKLILMLSSSAYLIRLKESIGVFSSCLTPQYRDLIKVLDFSLSPRAELIFHGCHPDIYLWVPKVEGEIKKLIVCFGTRKNSLNAPRPLVHFELAKAGVGLMYVGHRPDSDPAKGLLGRNLKSSADMLISIAQQHGFDSLYGLGASLGGYVALHYGPLMNFKKILNYSGAPDSFSGSNQTSGDWLKSISYPKEKVLTVLSDYDRTDKHIFESYVKNDFKTHMEKVVTPSHGSLTSAIVERRFQGHLRWLVDS